MRQKIRHLSLAAVAVICVACLVSNVEAKREWTKRIEAVRGKSYGLTKAHGPWMIMVATFRPVDEEVRTKGLTPKEAADQLVYELRKKGVPAYTYSRGEQSDYVESMDAFGNLKRKKVRSLDNSVCVLAGNYKHEEDKLGQDTVAKMKNFHPEFLGGVAKQGRYAVKLKNGGILKRTPGRPGPLSGAFLTINPMLSSEEISQLKATDPLLMKLNSESDNSLLENKGKYTLVVASFYGKSVTHVPGSMQNKKVNLASFKVTSALDEAAQNAWELTHALRNRGVEAYVYHDRYRSVVCVGSYESVKDPRIMQNVQNYRAKKVTDPATQREVLTAEALTIPKKIAPGQKPDRHWIFDPEPQIMTIPKL